MMPELTLYTRAGCHLCEEMERQLHQYYGPRPFRLRIVDIDTDPVLRGHYHDRIPVLEANGQEICQARLDRQRLGQVCPD